MMSKGDLDEYLEALVTSCPQGASSPKANRFGLVRSTLIDDRQSERADDRGLVDPHVRICILL